MGRKKKTDKNGKEDSPEKSAKIPSVSLNLARDTKRGIAVVVFVVLSGVTALALAGVAGSLGAFIKDALKSLFGVLAYLTPLIFLGVGVLLFRDKTDAAESKHFYLRTYLGSFLVVGSIAGLIHIVA